jgi:hypothetical protein
MRELMAVAYCTTNGNVVEQGGSLTMILDLEE